jgi:DNA-binding CsgD family transcriptional regulator
MLAPAAQRRLRGRAVECCRRAEDVRTLRLEVLDLLAEAVPYDAYAWLLTDPETAVGGSPIADLPCLPRLPELIRLKYLTPVNRWTAMTGSVARLLDATDGTPERSRVWRELLNEYDVSDVASVVFRDAHGCWGFLDLWRHGRGVGFTLAEERLLGEVAEVITPALRSLQARSFRAGPGERSERTETGLVVLLLGQDLEVLSQTAQTEAYLRTIVPTEAGRRPVPATAYNVAAQLLALEEGVDEHPPITRLHLAGGQWVTMSAARLGDTGPLAERAIAVTLQTTSPLDRLVVFARACGLTPRETAVVRELAAGTDSRRLARRLGVSEHTVQDHLKAIFVKTGTGSRLELLARTTGA